MSYGRYLRELLAPLRLYDLEAPFNGGELNVQGGALDGVDTWLAELRRESTLAEAESWGLERIIALLARRPVADTPDGDAESPGCADADRRGQLHPGGHQRHHLRVRRPCPCGGEGDPGRGGGLLP